MAPAELEGHLLDHPDVADVGVVGIPDEYCGEVPMAFIVLSSDAAARTTKGPDEAKAIKKSIEKVCTSRRLGSWLSFPIFSTSRTSRSITSGSEEVSSSSMSYPRIPVASFW